VGLAVLPRRVAVYKLVLRDLASFATFNFDRHRQAQAT